MLNTIKLCFGVKVVDFQLMVEKDHQKRLRERLNSVYLIDEWDRISHSSQLGFMFPYADLLTTEAYEIPTEFIKSHLMLTLEAKTAGTYLLPLIDHCWWCCIQ